MEKMEKNSIDLGRPSMRSARFVLNLEGETAALAGVPITANPYDVDTAYSAGWLEGWRAVKEHADYSLEPGKP